MNLTLTDKLILLALDDEKGTFVNFTQGFGYALAGAILMELNLKDKIEIKEKKILVKRSEREEDMLLETYYSLMRESAKVRKIDYWIDKLGCRESAIIKLVTERLVQNGILTLEEKKFLWIFSLKKYPTKNPKPEFKVRKQLINIIERGQEADLEELMLISLVDACNLNKEVYGKKKAKAYKDKIKAVIEKSKSNAAINATIKEVHDAIMTAIVLMITTSVVTTSVVTGN